MEENLLKNSLQPGSQIWLADHVYCVQPVGGFRTRREAGAIHSNLLGGIKALRPVRRLNTGQGGCAIHNKQ